MCCRFSIQLHAAAIVPVIIPQIRKSWHHLLPRTPHIIPAQQRAVFDAEAQFYGDG